MLTDKTILVTGASMGVGSRAARHCSNLGAQVIITARSADKLEVLLNELPNAAQHLSIPTDLSDANAIKSLAEQVPILDGLVLNAGVVNVMPLRFIKPDALDTMLNINVKSSILLVNHLLKLKKLRKGASVCIISSISSINPTPGNSVYAASKGALNSFTKAIALELAPKQIRVNAILPGFINTEMTADLMDAELTKNHLKNYPLGRFGETQDVANLISFILSDNSCWMTGNLINLDGGFSLK